MRSIDLAAIAAVIFSIPTMPVWAQIVPDRTLPENSLVTPNGSGFQIEGGTVAGSNLFHSFSAFSVPSGTEAFFNNPTAIANILARVTGGDISNIDGILRANGNANLVLVNPAGIIFGENARLDLGGSFLATTADRIEFADGLFFSTTHPTAAPLLTVSVPVGLQFGDVPGTIAVRGNGNTLILDRSGEEVLLARQLAIDPQRSGLRSPGRTLALVGGNVSVFGGNLIAESGRIQGKRILRKTAPIFSITAT